MLSWLGDKEKTTIQEKVGSKLENYSKKLSHLICLFSDPAFDEFKGYYSTVQKPRMADAGEGDGSDAGGGGGGGHNGLGGPGAGDGTNQPSTGRRIPAPFKISSF